jgi:hypothetical protein
MKSPWQLGLLALAVTGVSTYDIVFFMNRSHTSESAQQQALSFTTAPDLSAPAAGAQGDAGAFLPISKDELRMLSRQAYKPASTEETASENDWPARDPFSDHRRTDQAPVKIAELMPIKTPVPEAAPSMPAAPHCIFSGALIQSEHRLAIIDGNTVAIGAHWGIWRLSRIETDHIILEAGKETHRIELHDNESPSSQERDKS